ncbi:hypothetical protein [Pseudomonas sp. zfem005]|uniref:hypothetical protein n=1 Tax=Pseudomonas sp. zfem005 TaxID=3078200 RepID=UPI0029284013|nr:hypothetical protein [Pseudomonas sp. zfem005]MDU9416755.1 hypothetical protein [Pseudomonas sp. zfem005]
MRYRFFLVLLLLGTFSEGSIANQNSRWGVCNDLHEYSKDGGITEENLSQWVHGLDRPDSVEMSAGRAVRIQVEASTIGLAEIDERTWSGVDRSVSNLYTGVWRAFFMSVDIDNDGENERVAIYRKSGIFGQAYAYVLADGDEISRSYLGSDGRPLAVGGELFFYEGKVYWLQIDPRLDKKYKAHVSGWKRFIRVYRAESGTGLPILVYGVHGELCEISIKESG